MTGQRPDEPHAAERTGDSKRKLAMWLAVLALVLTILMVMFFTWWQREGEETEDEDVTRYELVESSAFGLTDRLVA